MRNWSAFLNTTNIYEILDTENSFSLPYFDSRIYHNLVLTGQKDSNGKFIVNTLDDKGTQYSDADYSSLQKSVNIYPLYTYGNYGYDLYESPGSVQKKILELQDELNSLKDSDNQPYKDELVTMIKEYKKRVEYIQKANDTSTGAFKDLVAPHSLIHPYAIVRLAGVMGRGVASDVNTTSYAYDRFFRRRWYEIQGDTTGGYAKNPTTSKLIEWGSEDLQGRTPYSFQDFVFCKYWNVIPNNRLITLRRYAAPVSDNIEFDNYKEYDIDKLKDKESITSSDLPGKIAMGWAPLATAVTYFGEETGNTLSNMLSFSAQYNWKTVEAESSPMDVEATANNEGDKLISGGLLSSAMSGMSLLTGMSKAMNGGFNPINATAEALPPDPYNNGPYENRIIGPVNVIMNTIKRDRGLKFTNDGLKIKFSYVARPIAGVNNKAVLLDLLSNMLVMCYSTGTWFGGAERFRIKPAGAYPFTYGKVMNKLYKGQILGRDGAIRTASTQMWDTGTTLLKDIFNEALSAVSNLFKSALAGVQSLFSNITGNTAQSEKEKKEAAELKNNVLSGKLFRGVQNMLAAHVLKGSTIPWLRHTGALLTGNPVGEWHLTIGNPLNPIAMIGNLVCKNLEITWMDELGPDDFPIGFEATVTLDHALGRDRDAIESMYNRGYGRIYSLPNGFRGAADGETAIDKYTGNSDPEGRTNYEEDVARATYFGGGGAWLGKIEEHPLFNANDSYSKYIGKLVPYNSLMANGFTSHASMPLYLLTPYQMAWTL